MAKYKIFIIVIVLFLGLIVRMYKFNSPIADWHSFRQTDTVAVTQIFAKNGLDFFHPRYFDLSSTQSGIDNPQGYRMVEAPIYNTISLWFHQITKYNIESSSRLVSIILSLCSGLLIFLFVFKNTNLFLPSLFSLIVFLFLPFNIFYSRSVLPEPTAVFFTVLSLYLFVDYFYLSALALCLAILVKPYTAIILFPTYLTLIYIYKSKFILNKNFYKLIIFGMISIIPFVLWRIWISQFPEGIPVSNWLLNNGVTTTFPTWYHGYDLSLLNKLVAFRPHWWYWLFQDRLGNLILGVYGIIPLFLGLAYQKKHIQPITISLIFGIFLYFVIVAQGNIQHDYYQSLIMPSISIICGIGYFYIHQIIFKNNFLKYFSILFIFSISSFFSYERVTEYYKINNTNIITAGQKVQELTPQNSIIIAPHNGDTAFLYHTSRSGFPIEVYNFENLINQFPHNPIYFTSVNFDDYTNKIISQFPTIYKNNQFIILEIQK